MVQVLNTMCKEILILMLIILGSLACGGGSGGSSNQGEFDILSAKISPQNLYKSDASDLFSLLELGSGSSVYEMKDEPLIASEDGSYTVNLRLDRSYLMSISRKGVFFTSTIISGNQIKSYFSDRDDQITSSTSLSTEPSLNLGELNSITTVLSLRLKDELDNVDRSATEDPIEEYIDNQFSSFSSVDSFADVTLDLLSQTTPELNLELLGRVNIMTLLQELIDAWEGGATEESIALDQLMTIVSSSTSIEEVWTKFRDENLSSFFNSVNPSGFMENFSEFSELFSLEGFTKDELQDLFWPESSDGIPEYVYTAIGESILYDYSGSLDASLISNVSDVLISVYDSNSILSASTNILNQASSLGDYDYTITGLGEGTYSLNVSIEQSGTSGLIASSVFSVPQDISDADDDVSTELFVYSGNINTMIVSGADTVSSYNLIAYDGNGEQVSSTSSFDELSSQLYAYSMPELAEGAYSVNLQFDDRYLASFEIEVPQNDVGEKFSYIGTIDSSIITDADGVIVLAYDGEDTVVAGSAPYFIDSESDYLYMLNGLEEGTYVVSVQKSGATLSSSVITVTEQ